MCVHFSGRLVLRVLVIIREQKGSSPNAICVRGACYQYTSTTKHRMTTTVEEHVLSRVSIIIFDAPFSPTGGVHERSRYWPNEVTVHK